MKFIRTVSVLVLAGFVGACATNKSVEEKLSTSQGEQNKRIDAISGQVEDLQTKSNQTNARLDQTNAQVAKLSQEAQEALKRAQEAGVLAKGKVAFEQAFTEERVKFKLNKYDLDKSSKTALDEFGNKVKALNEPVYIEIQGHTDDTGSARYNDQLGEMRAESVRRYLSREFKLPLSRMSTISYGDTLPVASNKTRAGRAQNRRVVLVVLE